MRSKAFLFLALISSACGQPEEALQVTVNPDMGSTAEEMGVEADTSAAPDVPEADTCDTCNEPTCWRECGEPDLPPPSAASTCESTPTFTDEFRLLMHLDPANLPNNLEFQGACGAGLSMVPEYTVSFVAPRDGEFLVGLEKLRGDGNYDLLSGVPSVSPGRVCEHFSDGRCSTNSGGYLVAARDVVAGQQVYYTVEVDAPGDFYLGGNYYSPPVERGAECGEEDICAGVATCAEGVCTCGEGALPGLSTDSDGQLIETCGCAVGEEANEDRTACVEAFNPCVPDPCPMGERCSVDGDQAVCAPSLARVGESCSDSENPCEAGLICKFIPCPYLAGGRMCVTPCSAASECNEANIACGRRQTAQQPLCESTSAASESYCTWDG